VIVGFVDTFVAANESVGAVTLCVALLGEVQTGAEFTLGVATVTAMSTAGMYGEVMATGIPFKKGEGQ